MGIWATTRRKLGRSGRKAIRNFTYPLGVSSAGGDTLGSTDGEDDGCGGARAANAPSLAAIAAAAFFLSSISPHAPPLGPDGGGGGGGTEGGAKGLKESGGGEGESRFCSC